jgi:hypothetical protein
LKDHPAAIEVLDRYAVEILGSLPLGDERPRPGLDPGCPGRGEDSMEDTIARQLLDEALEAYVDWQEESGAVWEAYRFWSMAPRRLRNDAFHEYRAALDNEQHTAELYAEAYGRLLRHYTGARALLETGVSLTNDEPLR